MLLLTSQLLGIGAQVLLTIAEAGFNKESKSADCASKVVFLIVPFTNYQVKANTSRLMTIKYSDLSPKAYLTYTTVGCNEKI